MLPVGQEQVWDALNAPEVLKECVPGCETIVATPDGFEVVLVAAVGPVKAKFKGNITLQDVRPPVGYRLVFSGQGGAAGYGKGEAAVTLASPGPGTTLLQYTAQASVGGKLAQIGSRLVDMASQKMAEDFFTAFVQVLLRRHGAPASAAPQQRSGGLLARLRAWLHRILGRGGFPT